jgi:hypothetical protein
MHEWVDLVKLDKRTKSPVVEGKIMGDQISINEFIRDSKKYLKSFKFQYLEHHFDGFEFYFDKQYMFENLKFWKKEYDKWRECLLSVIIKTKHNTGVEEDDDIYHLVYMNGLIKKRSNPFYQEIKKLNHLHKNELSYININNMKESVIDWNKIDGVIEDDPRTY